jgi:ubiquinone biosynthesis protein COQ4
MSSGEAPLYPRHVPTSGLQRLILAAGSAVAALADPYRADMVAVNGEVTGGAALQRMLATMMGSAEGRAVLAVRPRITSGQLPALARLPPGSLGHGYQAFLARHNITPDSRAEVQFVDCPDLAYVMTRYRETHDLTHLVLDMPPTMVGEVAVKWVEALQLGLPMAVGGAILGPLRYGARQRRQHRLLLPWAIATGRSMAPLLPVHWEDRWHQDIGDFRREFGIRPAPALQ